MNDASKIPILTILVEVETFGLPLTLAIVEATMLVDSTFGVVIQLDCHDIWSSFVVRV